MRGAFVGRQAELEAIAYTVARSVERPGPMAATVVGAPGSGKTRLLHEALSRVDGHRVFRAIGYEPARDVPLAAVQQLLRELTYARPGGRRLAAAAFGGRAWGQGGSPLRLFEAAFQALVGQTPAVLSIDDAQWVDDVSAALVGYVLRASAPGNTALTILAAGRPSAMTGALCDQLAAAVPVDSAVVEIDLSPLDEAAGIAMARSLTPGLSPIEAGRVWQAASGSPFWIEALATTGDAFEDSLARRLRQLGPDAAAVLQAVAVVARPTDRGELAAALDWPVERVDLAVNELRSRGLVVEGPAALESAHDLIREAARRQVPTEAARRLHARLARRLHAEAGGDIRVLREALDHGIAAGHNVLDIAIDLAEAPQRRLIGVAGVTALADLAASADPHDARRARLETRLADLATELGDRALELERWLLVAEHGSAATRARALLAASRAAYRMGMRETAMELVARCRAIRIDDPSIAIAVDAHESEILRWLEHRLPEARELTQRALAAAERALAVPDGRTAYAIPIRAACIEALRAACDLALQEGDERDQAAFAERIVELADGELERMEAQLLLSSAYRRAGRMESAESIARRVGEEAQRRLYPAVTVAAGHHLARALYAQARMDEAERVAADTEQLSARIGERGRFLSEIRALRPGIAVSRGDWRAGLNRLRDDIERETDPHYQLGIRQEIATWLARLGGPPDREEVRLRVSEATANLAEVGCPRCGRELTLRSAAALARIGDLKDARRTLANQRSDVARHSREGRLFLGEAIAAVRLAEGRYRRAAGTLDRLSRRLVAAGQLREALWTDIDRAVALRESDPGQAVALLRSVVSRAEAGGVLTDLQVARRRLRDLGARGAPPRPVAGPLGLSRRELEVAQLAATGASNPEIADSLFLSRKTVERHISAALSKTGARNRTELAARLTALTTAAAPPSGGAGRSEPAEPPLV